MSNQLPDLLEDLDIFTLLTMRLIESLNCSNIRPTEEEQYQNLQYFLQAKNIFRI